MSQNIDEKRFFTVLAKVIRTSSETVYRKYAAAENEPVNEIAAKMYGMV